MVFVGVFIRLHFSEQPAPGLSMEPRNKLARSSTRLALPARSQKDALQQEPQLCKRILASRHDRHRKDCFAKKKNPQSCQRFRATTGKSWEYCEYTAFRSATLWCLSDQ